MRPEAIFAPVITLALWTGVVLLMTGYRRLRAVAARRVKPSAFRLGDSAAVPEDVAVVNRNLMNLLEMPLLFYVVSIALYVTRQVQPSAVVLAWIYVGLRLAHSLIHVTYNGLRQRLVVFALSNFVLVAMWIRFAARVL
jgi:hypothetical protein